ncbi:hypothetical protein GWI24_12795 [Streptomyces sp. MK37H]|nr:hypothetical protein [Streptomyces sp. MK37H]
MFQRELASWMARVSARLDGMGWRLDAHGRVICAMSERLCVLGEDIAEVRGDVATLKAEAAQRPHGRPSGGAGRRPADLLTP